MQNLAYEPNHRVLTFYIFFLPLPSPLGEWWPHWYRLEAAAWAAGQQYAQQQLLRDPGTVQVRDVSSLQFSVHNRCFSLLPVVLNGEQGHAP